jgi:lipid II:glycine glycyltransferase (peptidoglycan interpeptide bridge formation enzyme)
MDNKNNNTWDEALEKMHGHLFQSNLWADFQKAQGRETYTDTGTGWSWMGAVRKASGIKYLYLAYGPNLESESKLADALGSIENKARELKVDFARMDFPTDISSTKLENSGLKHVSDMQATYHMVLDLTPSKEDLWKEVASRTKTYVNTAPKRNLSFEISDNPESLGEFLKIQAMTAKRQGISMYPESYYRALVNTLMPTGHCKIYFAKTPEDVIAGALCVDWGDTRYYLFAATNDELNRKAHGAQALMWWLIEDAKQQGLRAFDYGGVVPLDWDHHPWIGHTRFKKNYGGEIIKGGGTWDMPINKNKYRLYNLVKRVKK